MDGKGGDDPFDKIFSNFFGPGSMFNDQFKQMEDMFKHFEDNGTTIHIGQPPGLNKPNSPSSGNPRDLMLKDTDTEKTDTKISIHQPENIKTFINDRRDDDGKMSISIFGGNPGHFSMSSKKVSIVQKGDGSVEKKETSTENGRTCTTVTLTDPKGVSTVTTTCDRPQIDGTPSIMVKPSSDLPTVMATTPNLPSNNQQKPDRLFKRIFGFDLFNGKSDS